VIMGYYFAPTKTVEKEHIVYKDKIVEKKIYIKDTTKKDNKTTIRLVTIKPDGTRTIETRIIDKGELVVEQKATKTEDKTENLDSSKEKIVESSHNDWFLAIGAKYGVTTTNTSYGLHINRRIVGPFTLGVFGYTDQSYGATIGLTF